MDKELRQTILSKLQCSSECLVMTRNRANLYIDYKTGFVTKPAAANSFAIIRIDFDIKLYEFNSSKIAWQLEFSRFFAFAPTKTSNQSKQKGVPCQVLQCQDEDMFLNICKRLRVTKFPNGLNPNNTVWKREFNIRRINISGKEDQLENTGMCEGTFADFGATILQIQVDDKGDVRNIDRQLRSLDMHPNVLRFYESEGNDMKRLFAFERCQFSLETFLKSLQDPAMLKALDTRLLAVYRGILGVISLLHENKTPHNSLYPRNVFVAFDYTVKLSVLDTINHAIKKEKDPSLTQVSEDLEDDLYDVGELLLYCGSRGVYEFRKTRVIGVAKDPSKDVDMIDKWSQETRDIVKKLLNLKRVCRPSLEEVLVHPFIWDAEKRIRFLSKVTEYLKRFGGKLNSPIEIEIESKKQVVVGGNDWSLHGYDQNCLNYMQSFSYYNYGSVCDLIRFQRNAYQHFETIKYNGYTDFGIYSHEVEGIFRHKYPQLLMCVYEAVKIHARNDFMEYYD